MYAGPDGLRNGQDIDRHVDAELRRRHARVRTDYYDWVRVLSLSVSLLIVCSSNAHDSVPTVWELVSAPKQPFRRP